MATPVTSDPLLGTFGGAPSGTMRGISFSYAALALIHLALGIIFLAFPRQVAWLMFGVHSREAFKESDLEFLIRLSSTVFLLGAAVSWALKCAADNRTLGSTDSQRLKGGLMVFAPLAMIVLIVYHTYLTWWGLIAGLIVLAITLIIPFTAIGVADYRLLAFNNMLQGVTSGFRTMFDFRASTSALSSFCFALATLVFFLAGLLYIITPEWSHKAVFGYKPSMEHKLLWRLLGVALVTLVPTLTFVLKEAADNNFLSSTVPTSANAGFLLASLVHIVIFSYMIATQHVRTMLIVLLITWVLGLVASLIGMVTAHAGAASTEAGPYEQL